MKWISVKDKLPENKQEVIAFDDGCYMPTYKAYSEKYKWDCDTYNIHPTHWMPLPKPPKKK